MAKKANPRVVVQKLVTVWIATIELAGVDLAVCGRDQQRNTWVRKSLAMKAAERLRERLAGHDWSKCPIEVEE